MTLQTDSELIEMAKQGDRTAFDRLFYRYWSKLYVYAYKLTGQREMSQTIVQDVFISLWENLPQRNISQTDTYLFQSVKYQALKHYRNRRFNKEVLRDKFDEFIDEHPDQSSEKLTQKLFTLVDRLPEKCREIFFLNRIEELSIPEIAQRLHLSRQTVKNQLGKAFRILKANIDTN
ncbi:MAG: sigma-70 family RNA polymerase sigma factor [Breznakibacter sp.]